MSGQQDSKTGILPEIPSAKPPEAGGRVGPLKRVGALVPGIVASAARRHGFAAADVIASWREIAGDDIAALCRPLRISGSSPAGRRGEGGRTLVLAARREHALDIEYAADTIRERVNAYLGDSAIRRVSVEASDAAPEKPRQTPRRQPAPADEEGLSEIGDEGLRRSLARLRGEIAAERDRRGR